MYLSASFFLTAMFKPQRMWRTICYALFCAAVILSLSPSAAHAQLPASPAQQQRPRRVSTPPVEPASIEQSDDVLRIDTDLVLVDATVTNANGELVRDLRPKDFKIYEDGIEQPVSFFNVERRGGVPRPIAVVFALDVSGSMSPEELDQLGNAMHVFVKRLSNRSSVFAVMTFGMKVKTLQPFTNDPAKLERAFDRLAHEPNGLSTHTYDAVDDAVRLLVRNAPRTRERRLPGWRYSFGAHRY
jgi:hypothetical protein